MHHLSCLKHCTLIWSEIVGHSGIAFLMKDKFNICLHIHFDMQFMNVQPNAIPEAWTLICIINIYIYIYLIFSQVIRLQTLTQHRNKRDAKMVNLNIIYKNRSGCFYADS